MSATKRIFTNVKSEFGAEHQNLRFENLSTDPTLNLYAGRVYWNTVSKEIKVYDGTAWVSFTGTVSEWVNSVIAPINYIQTGSGAFTTVGATTGEKLLDLNTNKIYTSTSGDTWNTGVALTAGDRYIFKTNGSASVITGTGTSKVATNLIYEYNGTVTAATPTPTIGTFVSIDSDTTHLWYFNGTIWASVAFDNITASTGITRVGNDIQLAINTLGVNGTPNVASGTTDYFLIYNSSTLTHEKATLQSLLVAAAGTGLVSNASTGKLDIDAASAIEAQTGTATNKVITPNSIADFIHSASQTFAGTDWAVDPVGTGYVLVYDGTMTHIANVKNVKVFDDNGDEVMVGINISGDVVTLSALGTFAGHVDIAGTGYHA